MKWFEKSTYNEDRYKVTLALVLIGLCLLFLTGCSLTDSMVKESTGGIAKIQLANSANNIAKTRLAKAEVKKVFVNNVAQLINQQPLEKQAELISESIQAKVAIAEKTNFSGIKDGLLIAVGLHFLMIILMWFFNWLDPKQ